MHRQYGMGVAHPEKFETSPNEERVRAIAIRHTPLEARTANELATRSSSANTAWPGDCHTLKGRARFQVADEDLLHERAGGGCC